MAPSWSKSGTRVGSSVADQDERQHMLACEARYWLRRGYTTPDKILELGQLLKKRSNVALGRLIDEMREQWRRRREWE